MNSVTTVRSSTGRGMGSMIATDGRLVRSFAVPTAIDSRPSCRARAGKHFRFLGGDTGPRPNLYPSRMDLPIPDRWPDPRPGHRDSVVAVQTWIRANGSATGAGNGGASRANARTCGAI